MASARRIITLLLLFCSPLVGSWQAQFRTAVRGPPNGILRCSSRLRGGSARTPFLPKTNHPSAFSESALFSVWPECNDPAIAAYLGVGQRSRLGEKMLDHLDRTGIRTPIAAIARELALDGAVDSKEFFEATEFYQRVRKRVRRPAVVDLACGHGLTGVLFAALERTVERVLLVDARRPASFDAILSAVARAAPWTANKVRFCEEDLYTEAFAGTLPFELKGGGAEHGCVAVHACGVATDRCIEIASSIGGPVAAMPCCYTGAAHDAPFGLRRAFGKGLAADIDRTYRLHEAGYHVDWASIPDVVTPMNRIIVATPRGG